VSDPSRPDLAPDSVRPALDSDQVRAGLDREVRLVMEAILLVSSGGSPRVTVAGLHYAEQVLDASRSMATTRRARLIPLWTDDERGADVAVESLDAGEP
jgi:hypothetical protein